VAKHIVNQGRVVGMSAYEIYTKQLLSEDPTALPATEKEWLNSTLTYGSSMLIRVGTDDIVGPHYRDILFPNSSQMCAANTIMAYHFMGSGRPAPSTITRPVNSSNRDTNTAWAIEVLDYGPLITPAGGLSPIPDGIHGVDLDDFPLTPPNTTSPSLGNANMVLPRFSPDLVGEIEAYANITDGLVIHPGNYYNTVATGNPAVTRTLDPDLTEDWPHFANNAIPRLRLYFRDMQQLPVWILLTGFTNKNIVHGVTHTVSTGALTDPTFPSPQNGAFLGPGEFPWSSKIMFISSSALYTEVISERIRELEREFDDLWNIINQLINAINYLLYWLDYLFELIDFILDWLLNIQNNISLSIVWV